MDLTRLKHYLVVNDVQTEIDEPIGFDGLKTTIKRGDFHGVTAEVSVGTLEFYNSPNAKAADIIRDAYNTDIDTVVGYSVVDENDNEIYSGVIDLSTFEERAGNYTRIACKVGEIGAKTTFNVRTDTEVDLNETHTIDGSNLDFVPDWMHLNVPRKHLRYTNLFRQTYTQTITKDKEKNALRLFDNSGGRVSKNQYIILPFTKVVSSEFGDTSVGDTQICYYSNVFSYDNIINPLYETGDLEKFREEFGVNARCKLSIKAKVHLRFLDPLFTSTNDGRVFFFIGIGIANIAEGKSGQYRSYMESLRKEIRFNAGETYTDTIDFDFEQDGLEVYADSFNDDWALSFCIRLESVNNIQNNARVEITIDKGTEFKMVMTDNLEDDNVYVDMLPVHEALNKISGIISENQLQVRSEWYARPDSQTEQTLDFGGGSLKALTNGYKIRDLFTDSENKRAMQLSFKKAIQSLNVLDCIGWGFSKENGEWLVRVERWDWFYQNIVMLEINEPNEIKRRVTNDNIFNEIVIGYKKYETSSEYNSIDSVFGERVFTSSLKAVSNKKQLLCEFVADNYAIEETRRARNDKNETEQTTYDEQIFVFELACIVDWHSMEEIEEGTPPEIINYEVTNNAESASGVARKDEQLNVQLSPRRCAERWRSLLFATHSTQPYTFTSGKINCDATFQCREYDYPNQQSMFVVKHFLKDFANEHSMSEKKAVEYSKTKFKSEILEFSYPITIAQFNAIRDFPYGIIRVNGEDCWLKEITMKIATGECDFKVIPKNV